eukprot:3304258-Rhodomonas_salina.2
MLKCAEKSEGKRDLEGRLWLCWVSEEVKVLWADAWGEEEIVSRVAVARELGALEAGVQRLAPGPKAVVQLAREALGDSLFQLEPMPDDEVDVR